MAAAIHATVLASARFLPLPLPIVNLAGFLLASLWGYLAHATFSFRAYTAGERFPRRWLLLQFSSIVLLSLWLPWGFPLWATTIGGTLVLVFLPAVVNALIWCLATSHVVQLRRGDAHSAAAALVHHADDLGLDPAVNRAIFDLHDRGLLQGASVLLNGPALAEACSGLAERPALRLCLHLVLSEGPPLCDPAAVPDLLDQRGHLRLGFLTLLLLSFWPGVWDWPRLSRLRLQVALEVRAQIAAFQRLWPGRPLRLDGHQHVHLVPLVWRQLIRLEPSRRPRWLRSLDEPLPVGLPLACWMQCLVQGGLLKWLLLRLLSAWQVPQLASHGIATNTGFAGVLCTGRMGDRQLQACARSLRLRSLSSGAAGLDPADSAAILLSHPASARFDAASAGFVRSQGFYRSPWRQREFQALSASP